MRVEAIDGATLVQELREMIEQRRRDKYAFQVGLRDVRFIFDGHEVMGPDGDGQGVSIDQAEAYLRKGILTPVQLTEDDGTVHRVVDWDPRPVGYSGFMDCVVHSIATTDQGTFEVGRYPAVSLGTFGKVWQWFIHCKLERSQEE